MIPSKDATACAISDVDAGMLLATVDLDASSDHSATGCPSGRPRSLIVYDRLHRRISRGRRQQTIEL